MLTRTGFNSVSWLGDFVKNSTEQGVVCVGRDSWHYKNLYTVSRLLYDTTAIQELKTKQHN